MLMRFEIEFNEDVYKKQSDFLFKDEWRDYLKDKKKTLLYVIASMVFTIFLLYNEKYFGFVVLLFSLIFSIDYYKSLKFYFDVKKVHNKNVKIVIKQNQVEKEKSIWIFNDEFFLNSFNGFEGKYKWYKFESFKIINDMCIVYSNYEKKELGFVLSKEELEEEDFYSIIDFLDKKLKKII